VEVLRKTRRISRAAVRGTYGPGTP